MQKTEKNKTMVHTIENDFLKISATEEGAELKSILPKSTGKEYLWQGDKKYWDGRAYNLFPVCGRLTDGKYTYKGTEYEMSSHGFIRSSVLECKHISDTEMLFSLISNTETKKQYPFDFVYTVGYKLNNSTLTTTYTVKNTGSTPMYFAFGGHPGFNVPLNENENFSDYYLEFSSVKPAQKLVFTPFFDTGKKAPYTLKDGVIIELSHKMFENDGTFLTDIDKTVTLKSKKSDYSVRVDFKDFVNLGLWHTRNSEAPFICIEPWNSVPAFDGVVDDIETKKQMVKLESGKSHSESFDITIG